MSAWLCSVPLKQPWTKRILSPSVPRIWFATGDKRGIALFCMVDYTLVGNGNELLSNSHVVWHQIIYLYENNDFPVIEWYAIRKNRIALIFPNRRIYYGNRNSWPNTILAMRRTVRSNEKLGIRIHKIYNTSRQRPVWFKVQKIFVVRKPKV